MDWYLLTKFLHVSFAVLWLGGAGMMIIFGMAADRARNDQDIVETVLRVSWAAERVYVPSSILTLIFGVLATWIGGLWSELWVLLGLAGIAVTIALGVLVLTPMAKKVKASHSAGMTTEAVAVSRDLLSIAKFDLVVLFSIVALMVLKPEPGNWVTLLVLALVIAAAGLAFLRPLTRQRMATA